MLCNGSTFQKLTAMSLTKIVIEKLATIGGIGRTFGETHPDLNYDGVAALAGVLKSYP